MAQVDDDSEDDSGELLKALAWTPRVAPFTGTERYRVHACLGEGGFGVVYEVDDREQGRRVALKTLKPNRAGFASSIERLKREFRSVADLVHPNLAALYELSSHASRWFFTMELVRGCDFHTYVRGDEARLRSALAQLVAGVTALHNAGIVHRDLKPSNVLVEHGGRVVVLDFGLADSAHDPELHAAGTPTYMAPEQVAGDAVTTAADWYAVGVMLNEALARLPADLGRLRDALMRTNPSERPDAAAIHAMLGHEAPVVHDDVRFVGRWHELQTLREAYAKRPALVCVQGQPGVGKSALVDQFCDEVDHEAIVLRGRCHERETVPFKAFDSVVDNLVAYLRSLPRHEAAGLMPRDIALVTQLFPVLDGVSAAHDVPSASPSVDPRENRLRSFAAIKELLARLADKSPLVIVIDDLQWSDVDSARLLSQLFAPPRPSVLFVLAYRGEDAGTSPALRETLRMLDSSGARRVELAIEPLPPADAEALASTLGSANPRVIAERGEGHPLFICELARAVAEHDRRGEQAVSLIDMLWQRVQRLSASARALLETIAVAGEPLPVGLCATAAGLGDEVVDAVRMLRAERLIRAGERGEINVFHDRVRDAVIARADARSRRQRHLSLARSLERAPDPDLESVARHFGAADEHEQASRYAERAADVAMKSLAFERAAELFQMAIDRDPRGGSAAIYEKLGDAFLHGDMDAAAGRAYLEAAARATGLHATDLRRRAGEHLLAIGDVTAGFAAIEQALADMGERLPASRGQSIREVMRHFPFVKLGGLRFRERDESTIPPEQLLRLDVLASAVKGLISADFARALGVMMRYIRGALKLGEPRRVALALTWAAAVPSGPERSPRIDRLLDQAEALATRFSDWNTRSYVMRARAQSLFFWGALVRCREACDETAAFIAARCSGVGETTRFMRMLAAAMDGLIGELEQARRRGKRELLAAFERADPVSGRLICVCVLVPVSLADDDLDRAQYYQEQFPGEDRCAAILLAANAEATIAMYRGEPRAAIDAWRSRYAQIVADMLLMPPGFRFFYVRSLATALYAASNGKQHVREIRKLASLVRKLRFPQARAIHTNLRAYVAFLDGKRERGNELLLEAAEHYALADLALDAAACRYRAGQTESAEVLRKKGIVNIERWVNAVVPARPGTHVFGE